MEVKKSYLVIWQIGSNDQSRDETPIDVMIDENSTADYIYDIILKTLKSKTGQYDLVNILGIFSI